MRIMDSLTRRRASGPTLPYDKAEEAGWDKLWTGYLKKYPYQSKHQDEFRLAQLPADRAAMVDLLDMHAPAEAISGKTVLEVGSGAGYLAKRIAHTTERYVGIDWSGLALSVARKTCPERTTFLHATDQKEIRKLAGNVDTVVCRNFMIHQPFGRSLAVLAFDAAMLRPGGKVYADFWQDEPSIHDGHGVWGAHEPGPVHNAVFRYTDDDYVQLAQRCGLTIDDVYDRPDKNRHFVTFRKA
jgi:SAM-dependent methyltransferase